MATNDLFLIDGIIEERINNRIPSSDIGEAFELFAMEQLLKEYDLSREEILSNCVDGKDDGGIDYIVLFINGHMIDDPNDFVFPRTNAIFEIFFVSCKHADSFKLAPVDSLCASLNELLNFSIPDTSLSGKYNDEVLKKRENIRQSYKKIATDEKSEIKVHVVYACRGDSKDVAENVRARSHQVESLISSYFRDSEASFVFFGSPDILTQYRKIKEYDIDLPFEKNMGKGEHGVFLVELAEYYRFITEPDGKLRRYLFDTNVRSYMGVNRTNQDILETLNDANSPDFWLLNNGVTMIVDHAHIVGDTVTLKNIQIVNGLQTSETIYNFFSEGGVDLQNRCVLVKTLKVSDSNTRDAIIKATNNQTEVTISALHSTDKIQKDIDAALQTVGLYYERRTKYYENQNVDPALIITPLTLAAAYVSVIQRLPATAAKLKQKFMNNEDQYHSVFSETVSIKVWPQLALLDKKTDGFLHSIRHKYRNRGSGAKFYKYIRQPLMMLLVAYKCGTFAYSERDVIKLDIENITADDYLAVWKYFDEAICQNTTYLPISTVPIIHSICEKSGFTNIQAVKAAKSPLTATVYRQFTLDEEFLLEVKAKLPEQPWPQGVHRSVADVIGCPPGKVYQAISKLIDRGEFKKQVNGVLFDE